MTKNTLPQFKNFLLPITLRVREIFGNFTINLDRIVLNQLNLT